MKNLRKLIYPLALLTVLFTQVGCEGHQKDEFIQQEQEQASKDNEGMQNGVQKPHIESEHGGNAGNR